MQGDIENTIKITLYFHFNQSNHQMTKSNQWTLFRYILSKKWTKKILSLVSDGAKNEFHSTMRYLLMLERPVADRTKIVRPRQLRSKKDGCGCHFWSIDQKEGAPWSNLTFY